MNQDEFQDELLQRMDDVHRHEVYYDAMTARIAEHLKEIAVYTRVTMFACIGILSLLVGVGLGVIAYG